MKKRESEHHPLTSNWRLVEQHGLLIRRRRQAPLPRYNPSAITPADFEKAQKKAEKARRKSGEFANSIRLNLKKEEE